MSQWSNYMSRQLVLFVAKNLHLHISTWWKKMLSLDYLSVILTLSISEGKYATLQHLYLSLWLMFFFVRSQWFACSQPWILQQCDALEGRTSGVSDIKKIPRNFIDRTELQLKVHFAQNGALIKIARVLCQVEKL